MVDAVDAEGNIVSIPNDQDLRPCPGCEMYMAEECYLDCPCSKYEGYIHTCHLCRVWATLTEEYDPGAWTACKLWKEKKES